MRWIDFTPYIRTLSTDLVRVKAPPSTLDVVISAGGMRGMYACGLMYLLRDCGTRVRRIYGASVGALIGLAFVCDISLHHMRMAYECLAEDGPKKKAILTTLEECIREWLPSDAYVRCSDRLFITVSEFQSYGRFRKHVVSRFSDNDDLIQAVMASAALTYITTDSKGYVEFRGMRCMDGYYCLATNDGMPDAQRTNGVPLLHINLLHVSDYSVFKTLSATDPYIDSLILRGIQDAYRFLIGDESIKSAAPVFYWTPPVFGIIAQVRRLGALAYHLLLP